ncbi:MAG: hypothetical protein JXB15_02140 [Anaerolineales bacterium]|nr:hypothetical protein [Anaerolineales bacterium]
MLYRDLVQFEPIETVIQLRDANQQSIANHLVKTYVVSDRISDQLTNLVIPQLQFDRPQDNKGVLIVGNYGTGKSHLMSVISAAAEFSDTAELLTHAGVRSAAKAIAGRFKVLRVEIGSTTRSLRDILLEELQIALERWEAPYTFPPASQITNNKNDLIQAVANFQRKYPNQGIMLVVDELLDYLLSREQRALLLDLGFLRELGEVAASIPLRLLAGLQESLFDSPRFSFVANELRRVRDRFEQVRIAREDIAFVVANRLLRKNDAQLAQITEHLRQFTPLYRSMAERLDEFARLFPIHPAYIETFEQVAIAEKREVLKSFSLAIRTLLDQDVPADRPGLVSYDHYWGIIRENASLRSMTQVAQVIEKSAVLEGRIRNAYTRPNLMDMALRIISALSVHRLTTSDIFVPLGVTAEELRDGLCLHTRLPEVTADFLLDQVQVALRETMRTVQGQFLSNNPENGQYYLDLKKVVDFDAKIAERGDFMERPDLNQYFFDALRLALSLSDTTYVTNYNIWFYELPWVEHKVTRPGYLFFGAPDERSTAQPPRDFYVFWLPPFLDRQWHDEQRSDEVIFELAGLGEDFEHKVRLYAGARALANESTEYRREYADKADEHFRTLRRWLNEHLTEHQYVIYQGVRQPISAVLGQLRSSASQTLEDLLRLVAAFLLSPEFQERYPLYPSFHRLSQPVSEAARENSAMEALRALAGRPRTALAAAVLEGLELLDNTNVNAESGDSIRPANSPYAHRFLELLESKPEGQVINRGELIEQVSGGLAPIEKDIFFHLEPEWVVVVLLSLVYSGDIVLNVDGREEIDASSLERALTLSLQTLGDFRFFKRPRNLPLSQWVAIFDGLGLPSGLIRDENTRPRGVEELQRTVNAELEKAAALQERLNQGLALWNMPVFTDRYTMVIESGSVVSSDQPMQTLSVTQLLPGLRGYKQYLEEISRINTVGKLRNLRLTSADIALAQEHRAVVQRAQQLVEVVAQIQPISTYLVEAQANLPADHDWVVWALDEQQKTLDLVRKFGQGEAQMDIPAVSQRLAQLKNGYIAAYAKLHRQLVLGPQADERRVRLYSDARLRALEQLAQIELLNRSELETWKQTIHSLPTCREFHEGAIVDTPTCPSCRLRPNQASTLRAEQSLEMLEARLDDLLRRWRQALRSNLGSETAQHSLQAMTPAERQPIEAFLAQDDTDPAIPAGFVTSASQALRGIEAITLPLDDLLQALHAGGMPCTADELQRRFEAFVAQQMRGHDARNTRLMLDR